MNSERLNGLLDVISFKKPPIARLVARLKEERRLGYYKQHRGDELLRVVIKWAEKYQRGED